MVTEIQESSVRGNVTDKLNLVVDGNIIAWACRDMPLGGWTVYRSHYRVPIDRREDVETFLYMIADTHSTYQG